MRLRNKIFAVLASALISSSVTAGNILLTQFDFSGYADMKANLEADGHTVDIINAKVQGNVANALANKSYDQVFLWDLTSRNYLGNQDIAAINNFWDTSKGIVVDTRSYGYHFQPNQSSEVALLKNVAKNLDLSGGGLWVGTDHDPSWTRNANPVLSALGFNTVTGLHSDPVNFADPTSVLLDNVTPTDLWGGGQSVGRAPIGIQPNGLEMFIHFGNIDSQGSILPYISANFDLQGPVVTPKPSAVPVPAAAWLFAPALAGFLGLNARRKAKLVKS
jgi:hypothetical protein